MKPRDLPAKIHELIGGHTSFAFIGNPGANFKSKFFGINMVNGRMHGIATIDKIDIIQGFFS
jgi:hypothetical protein